MPLLSEQLQRIHNPLGPRDQDKVSSATVGDGGSELDDVVVMPFGNLSEFVIVEGVEGLDGTPVPTVGPVVTHPVSSRSP